MVGWIHHEHPTWVEHLDTHALHARMLVVVQLAHEAGLHMKALVRDLALAVVNEDLDPTQPEQRARLSVVLTLPGMAALGRVRAVSRLSGERG